jgi:hypothetical protein
MKISPAALSDRRVFVFAVAAIFLFKLLLCAVVPPSFDMLTIAKLVQSHAALGPMIILYPAAYYSSNATLLQSWLFAPPIPVNVDYWAISLLFRLPLLLLDAGTGVLIYFFVRTNGGPLKARVACLIWFANPYPFLATELLGVPDILATLLLLTAFVLLLWRRPVLAAIFLGLAVWVKFYPILLLIPVLLFEHYSGFSRRNKLAMLCFGVAGLCGYLLWISPNLYQYVTTYTPVTQPIELLGGESTVNGTALILVLFYFLIAKFRVELKNIIHVSVATILVYFAVSSPRPQYLTWIMPLMIIDLTVWNRSRRWLFSVFYVLAFAEWFLTSPGLVTPSGYSLLLIPLVGGNAVATFLESYSTITITQVVSSSFYASLLLYLLDIIRTWFSSESQGVRQNWEQPLARS